MPEQPIRLRGLLRSRFGLFLMHKSGIYPLQRFA